MKAKTFIKQALAHYKAKLAEETERFEVLGISDAWVENNSHKVVQEDEAGQMWARISEQSGMHLVVDYAPGNPQCVFAVLSKERIPEVCHHYELWLIINDLEDSVETDEAKLEALELYEGPYKLDLPENLMVGD